MSIHVLELWHHLLGTACPRMHTLELYSVSLGRSLICSLMAAPNLRHLVLDQVTELNASFTTAVSNQLPVWLPSLSHLTLNADVNPSLVMETIAPQLTQLDIKRCHDPHHEHHAHLDAIATCLPLCVNLTSVSLPVNCTSDVVFEALLGLEHLRHVHMRYSRNMTRSFADRPCKWKSLELGGIIAASCVPLLPLQYIPQVTVHSLEVAVTADADAVRRQVHGAAEVLAALAQQGQLKWHVKDSVWISIRCDDAQAEADEAPEQGLPEASVTAALSSWAPLKPFLKSVFISWFPAEDRISKRLVTDVDLRALSDAFGSSLEVLSLSLVRLAPSFWRALQQGVLPQLSCLRLESFDTLSTSDFAVFCASTTHPLTVVLDCPSFQAAHAAVQVQRSLSGVLSSSVVQIEVVDGYGVLGFVEGEGDGFEGEGDGFEGGDDGMNGNGGW